MNKIDKDNVLKMFLKDTRFIILYDNDNPTHHFVEREGIMKHRGQTPIDYLDPINYRDAYETVLDEETFRYIQNGELSA